jgi:hypothetical protein
MMKFPIYGNIKAMLQTTTQICLSSYLYLSQYMKASFLPLHQPEWVNVSWADMGQFTQEIS